MVKLNKIYTKTGDEGETSLTGGKRISKNDLRVATYGTVDEANACIGIARVKTTGNIDRALARIQNDLFDLGADLSTPLEENEQNALRITQNQIDWLESQIDALNESLEPLKSFVLPGGTEAASRLHLARTVVRRAERLTVELAKKEKINEAAIRYLNRLSDYLFVLSRHLNNNGKNDVLWVPGAGRKP